MTIRPYALRGPDVEAELRLCDGMCHGWQLFAPMLEEGMASIEQAAQFIRAQMRSK